MITVDNLVTVPGLGITYLAGAGGGGRPVSWAHAVDLPNPWQWIDPGDLVMTTGGGMPEGPEQAEWLRQLVDAGAAGLILAPRPGAPQIDPAMTQLAEVRNFPLLSAPFELEFVSLARMVIKNSLDLERARLEKAKRLFDAYGEALSRGADRAVRLAAVARAVGWKLRLTDDLTGRLVGSSHPLADRFPDDMGRTKVQVPGRMAASLEISTEEDTPPDMLLAHYAAGIISLELEQQARYLDKRRAEGEQILQSLLKGAVELSAVTAVMDRLPDVEDLVLLRIDPGGQGAYCAQTLHLAVAMQEPGMLLSEDGEELLALVHNEPTLIGEVGALLGEGTRLGVSLPLSAVNGVPEARRQTLLALQDARETGVPLCVYGGGSAEHSFFPRSASESRALVDEILGPVLAHDKANKGDLLRTLRRYLEDDRSLIKTSQQLNIHRQTLVYRLNSIEQLTGMHPSSTQGIMKFWFALQAGERAGLI